MVFSNAFAISLTWLALILCRGIIAYSISAPHEKNLVQFTGLTGIDTSRSVDK